MRKDDLDVFYRLISKLEQTIGGARKLSDCSGYLDWPNRGAYFFQEPGELRDNSDQPRIVRVGTHALKTGAKTKIWNRLSQHKGQKRSGGGNHRSSIFRLTIGASLIERDCLMYPTWGKGSSAPREIRDTELPLERTVSDVIGNMPFLWLAIEDKAGPDSLRGYIEKNSIALLSNYENPPFDHPSKNWLGQWCNRLRVRKSGLWNSNHINENYDPVFLDALEELIQKMEGKS